MVFSLARTSCRRSLPASSRDAALAGASRRRWIRAVRRRRRCNPAPRIGSEQRQARCSEQFWAMNYELDSTSGTYVGMLLRHAGACLSHPDDAGLDAVRAGRRRRASGLGPREVRRDADDLSRQARAVVDPAAGGADVPELLRRRNDGLRGGHRRRGPGHRPGVSGHAVELRRRGDAADLPAVQGGRHGERRGLPGTVARDRAVHHDDRHARQPPRDHPQQLDLRRGDREHHATTRCGGPTSTWARPTRPTSTRRARALERAVRSVPLVVARRRRRRWRWWSWAPRASTGRSAAGPAASSSATPSRPSSAP